MWTVDGSNRWIVEMEVMFHLMYKGREEVIVFEVFQIIIHTLNTNTLDCEINVPMVALLSMEFYVLGEFSG